MRHRSNLLAELISPRCINCDGTRDARDRPLCISCTRALPWWRRVDGCPRCGGAMPCAPTPAASGESATYEGCAHCLADGSALHACHTLARYEGPIRRWLPGFKNGKSPFGPGIALRLAVEYLARQLARRVAADTRARPDLIVPVPLHERRHRSRGFNHVDPMARLLAASLDVAWQPNALERLVDTPSQAGLVGRARRTNLRGQFRTTSKLGSASRIWLVDDVLTTGSTLDAAADALLEAGCVEVRGLTLAATLPARRTRQATQTESAYHAAPATSRFIRSR